MFTRATSQRNPWDDVEHAILRAVQETGSVPSIADRAGLTRDVVKAQLATFEGEGLVMQPLPGGGRWHLTLAGFKRMFELADTTDRPGHQAAA